MYVDCGIGCKIGVGFGLILLIGINQVYIVNLQQIIDFYDVFDMVKYVLSDFVYDMYVFCDKFVW